MRHISEVLRLAAAGMSLGQVGSSLGLSKSTVHGYLERAKRAGLSWPLPGDLDAVALEARLFPSMAESPPTRPEPDWREVHRELKRKRQVTLQLLWLEFRATTPPAGVHAV